MPGQRERRAGYWRMRAAYEGVLAKQLTQEAMGEPLDWRWYALELEGLVMGVLQEAEEWQGGDDE